MSKTVAESKFSEWMGLDRISIVVHSMKCIWREITKDDFGIDGEIEIVVPKQDGNGFETLGHVVKVQAKSGKKYVVQDTSTSFATPVEKQDLELWNHSRYPVLLIVYHPNDDKLYCKELRSYIKSSTNVFRPPHRVIFDKRADEFNTDYFSQVREHAHVSEPRVSLQHKEELYSNLFPVRRPPTLYHAATDYTSVDEVRAEAADHLPPICIVEGRLFTFCDLWTTQGDILRFCGRDFKSTKAAEWIDGKPERQRDYVYLLNQLLGKIRYQRRLRYSKDYQRTYFPRQNETDKEFKEPWFNVRTQQKVEPRIVVKYYEYGVDRFWRHLACHLSFLRFDGDWFLRIIPKYFFTFDGEHACEGELAGPYTTKLKAMEHNMQVLNHVLFWADYLSAGEDFIASRIDNKMVINIDKAPVGGISGFAIPDDPAIFEEKPPPPLQLDLFEALKEDEDD